LENIDFKMHQASNNERATPLLYVNTGIRCPLLQLGHKSRKNIGCLNPKYASVLLEVDSKEQ